MRRSALEGAYVFSLRAEIISINIVVPISTHELSIAAQAEPVAIKVRIVNELLLQIFHIELHSFTIVTWCHAFPLFWP